MGRRGPKPKDTCVNGHGLTDGNIKLVKRGQYTERQCLTCARIRARVWWQKNRSV